MSDKQSIYEERAATFAVIVDVRKTLAEVQKTLADLQRRLDETGLGEEVENRG